MIFQLFSQSLHAELNVGVRLCHPVKIFFKRCSDDWIVNRAPGWYDIGVLVCWRLFVHSRNTSFQRRQIMLDMDARLTAAVISSMRTNCCHLRTMEWLEIIERMRAMRSAADVSRQERETTRLTMMCVWTTDRTPCRPRSAPIRQVSILVCNLVWRHRCDFGPNHGIIIGVQQ